MNITPSLSASLAIKNAFARSHKRIGLSVLRLLFENREEDKERKPYLFSAEMASLVPAQVGLVTLVPYVDKQLNLCLWPLKHNHPDRPNDYNSSAMDIARNAILEWGHMVNSGGIYTWIPGIGNWPDPELPDLLIEDMIEKAFPGDRYIEEDVHPFMQELLGA